MRQGDDDNVSSQLDSGGPTAMANIALEHGFASMCGKPLVIVKSKAAPSPSDLTRAYWIEYDPAVSTASVEIGTKPWTNSTDLSDPPNRCSTAPWKRRRWTARSLLSAPARGSWSPRRRSFSTARRKLHSDQGCHERRPNRQLGTGVAKLACSSSKGADHCEPCGLNNEEPIV